MLELIVLAFIALQSVPDNGGTTVVVTARSLESTERSLSECLARQCSPSEDIEASIAHGENLFVTGNYTDARRVLAKSRARNLRYAKTLPVQVGDLSRAYGRVAALDGHVDTGRLAQIEALEALEVGLGRNDSRVLAQRLMIADEYLKAGRLTAADEVFASVEKRAVAAKLPRMQGIAMLRQAVVYGAMASVNSRYRSAARYRIKRLQESTDPALAPFRELAGLLKAQLAAAQGDQAKLNAAIAELDTSRHSRPLLIYAPAIDLPQQGESSLTIPVQRGEDRPEWIDVGFEIGLDGKVTDAEILRKTDTVSGIWPEFVRKALIARRYAPIGPNVDRSLLQRTERFSMVFNLARLNGSRVVSRAPNGQIMSLDLTNDPVVAGESASLKNSPAND